MSLFNDELKSIELKELVLVVLALFLIQFLLASLDIADVSPAVIYAFIILYFIYKLKDSFSSFKQDLADIFSKDLLKEILVVVILNIFLSYGFLYLSDFILSVFPAFESFINLRFSLNYSLIALGGFITTVLISPISEELIFRGVLLNKLGKIVPTLFSILITSLLFASMHSFGSIISAFIFAICMAILYLKTDNIFVPIFAHFLNNLFAEIIVIADTSDILFTNPSVVFIVSVLAVISFCLVMFLIIKELNSIK